MENTADFEVTQDVRQSEEYAAYIKSIGWKVITINNINIFLRNFLGLKIAKIQRTGEIKDWGNIFKILKKEKVFSLRWEPLESVTNIQWPVSSWPLLGTKTLRVNLRPSEQQIFNSFKKDCRYILRRYQIPDARFQMNEFDSFYGIWRKEAKRKGLWIPGKKEYQNLVKSFGEKIFCLTYENLAGVVILMHKKTAYYYYSACLPAGKLLQLPYLLVWTAMKKAKKMGCIIWDFEGIYDDRWPSKGWKGFSHFKKSFGGKEIEFSGSFQKWLWPW